MKRDIKTFFGTYEDAIKEATDLLFSVGKAENIARACKDAYDALGYGFLDGEHSFTIQLLVVIGAMKDGSKRFLAIEAGYRESQESWAGVLRQLKGRGLKKIRLVIGDGNLGLWAAVGEVFPEAAEQICWNHSVPRRAQTRRMKCSFTDKTSKSVSLGQMVAA